MLKFNYIDVTEADQFQFYRIPKQLFTDSRFKNISCDAKLLYGLLLDRVGLSIKNNWIDEDGHAYIIFKIEEISEMLGYGHSKVIKILNELDVKKGIGLVERCRRGLGKSNIIYIMNFNSISDSGECDDKCGNSEGEPLTEECPEQDNDPSRESGTNIPGKETNSETAYPHNQTPVAGYEINHEAVPDPSGFYIDSNGRVWANKEASGKNYDIPDKGEVPDFQNSEKRKSRLPKCGNQEFRKTEIKTSEMWKSRLPKNGNQDFRKMEIKNSEKRKSRLPKNGNQEFRNAETNDTDYSYTDLSNTDYSDTDKNYTDQSDTYDYDTIYPSFHPSIQEYSTRRMDRRMDEQESRWDAVRETVADQVHADAIISRDGGIYAAEVNEIVDIIAEVAAGNAAYYTINGSRIPGEVVRSQFMKLNMFHIEYVIDCLKEASENVIIRNMKYYIISCLYNAPQTMQNHVSCQVRYDMANMWEQTDA